MKIIAVIPARYASTRLPAKLVQDLGGKPLILQTYYACIQSKLFDEVWVATDSPIIYNILTSHQAKVVLSTQNHESGSDRIAEAVKEMDVDIVVNVQGDEPFIDRESLQKAIQVLQNDTENTIDLVSLMTPLTDPEAIQNPNNVKVVTDTQLKALYFSRSAIPFNRDNIAHTKYYKHIGVYAFRKTALINFSQWKPTPLELTEKLEQLRYLENGKRIQMVLTHHTGIGIDTPEDLEKARKLWK